MKRRAAGEGTVRQRADGKWEGYTTRDEFGKRKKRVRDTQREVLAALAQLRDKGKRAEDEKDGRQFFRAFLPDWVDRVKRPKLRERTHEDYSGTIRRHILPTFGSMRIKAMNSLHVEHWHAKLHAKHPRVAGYAKMILAEALDYAKKKGWVEYNAAREAECAPQPAPAPIAPLTPEQARAFLEVIAGHRLEVLYRLALSLGLRRGEVLGIKWEDVDLDKGTIRIAGTLQRSGGKLKRGKTKTEGSAAVLPLPRSLVIALRQHKERQAEERKKLIDAGVWIETGYVFISTVGTPLEPRNIVRQFKGFLVRAGIRVIEHERVVKDHHGKKRKQTVKTSEVRFHDLRHSCATLLIAQGEHPRTVMQYLRHTRISTTMDLYGHVYDEAHAAAAERLDAVLEIAPREDRVLELEPRKRD